MAARVIAVVTQKGGAGKTTTAINIAAALAETGARVLLIDADPHSHSASDWSAVREQPPPFMLVALPQPVLHRDVPKLAADYDFVVIDGPPQESEITRSAIAAADLVIIPAQPSGADFRASSGTVKLVKESLAFKETQKSVFLVSRRKAQTALGRDIREALATFELPLLVADVPDRIVYAEAITKGTTIFEEQPRGPGPEDFRILMAEIERLVA